MIFLLVCWNNYVELRDSSKGKPSTITAQGQEIAVVEEFVYLGSLIHSTTQSPPDISRRNVITRAAMQSLDNQTWKSRISISAKLKLYNTCILPIFLYGSKCWAVTKIDALDQWCLHKLLGIKWYHYVWNDDVRRKLSNHIFRLLFKHSVSLSLFAHIARMRDESDAKQILTASPLGELEETAGTPRTAWMKTIQRDLESLNLSLNEAIDVAQNHPLWRMMPMFGATHS